MKYLKTFEDNKKTKPLTFQKMQYCKKCEKRTRHLENKCLVCKKREEQEKERQKKWGVK